MYHVPEGKRPLGKPRSGWDDNSKMDLGKIGWGDVGWKTLMLCKLQW
jgi:hypothetical protein